MLKKIKYSIIIRDNCQKATETLRMGHRTPLAHESFQAAHPMPSIILTWSSLERSFLDLFSRKTKSWGSRRWGNWIKVVKMYKVPVTRKISTGDVWYNMTIVNTAV